MVSAFHAASGGTAGDFSDLLPRIGVNLNNTDTGAIGGMSLGALNLTTTDISGANKFLQPRDQALDCGNGLRASRCADVTRRAGRRTLLTA